MGVFFFTQTNVFSNDVVYRHVATHSLKRPLPAVPAVAVARVVVVLIGPVDGPCAPCAEELVAQLAAEMVAAVSGLPRGDAHSPAVPEPKLARDDGVQLRVGEEVRLLAAAAAAAPRLPPRRPPSAATTPCRSTTISAPRDSASVKWLNASGVRRTDAAVSPQLSFHLAYSPAPLRSSSSVA